jgi:DNA-binding MarR family transcriptional regulator
MVTGRINRETDRLLHDLDVSRNAMITLAALRRSGDAQRLLPRELSQAALLSSAGMTSQLDQLEERGPVADRRIRKTAARSMSR